MDPTEVPLLVRSDSVPGVRGVLDVSFLGYTTTAWPDRVYDGLDAARRPPSVRAGEHVDDVTPLPSPAEALSGDGGPLGWAEASRRALTRAEGAWLLAEDRWRLLDSASVDVLAHQASLVQHVLASPSLRRVLIADEVGLGKTIEVGLILQRLRREADATGRALRVLYLTEARLVENVIEEFAKLGLAARRWASGREEGRLGDASTGEMPDGLVVASMHRAAYRGARVDHLERVAQSGPWDVIVVDEAHHLTDWSTDGRDPQQRMRLVRRLVDERLVPDGRLILLTGTPHQGSDARFKNLLQLLTVKGEDLKAARGRVIYRIKDEITDWDGNPLFPRREVRAPETIEVSEAYHAWLEAIHEVLEPRQGTRAGAWRRAHALQWAASSPEAGLAFFVRMALRAGVTAAADPATAEAMRALRPYRGGSDQEELAVLSKRMVGALDPDEVDDEAEELVRSGAFSALLRQGTALVKSGALDEKVVRLRRLLDESPEEKFVVFAQPVETVYALRQRLERALGRGNTALIVGSQDEAARRQEIQRFRERDEVRVLISSRAGGEGINLQVSRRLVHFDLPWNPMDMEQRVGRVHRYGSVHTIIVDTLLVAESREERVLERCRARLGRIVADLAGGENSSRFEALFSRTMSLIPTEQLEALMVGEKFGPLSVQEATRLDQLVSEGFDRWQEADREFRAMRQKVEAQSRGSVTLDDLESFLVRLGGAKREAGWRSVSLESSEDGTTRPVRRDAAVLQLESGARGYVGVQRGLKLEPPAGVNDRPSRFGLNHPIVGERVRQGFFGDDPEARGDHAFVHGAARVSVDQAGWETLCKLAGAPGTSDPIVVVMTMTREFDPPNNMRETGSMIHVRLGAGPLGPSCDLEGEDLGSALRALRSAVPRRWERIPSELAERATSMERSLAKTWRTRREGRRAHAVFPLFAAVVTPPGA